MTNRKTALITGASRGLGRGMAEHLCRSGIRVIATFLRGREEAEHLAAEVTRNGGEIVVLPLDVTDFQSYPSFVDEVRQSLQTRFGASNLDYLINNAGIGTFAMFSDTTAAQFDDLVEVNLKAPFFLSQALLPLIGDGGRILNVTAAVTRGVVPGLSAYAATKGGIEALTRYQAVELAGRGIRVNAIMGGAVDTGLGDGMMRSEQVRAQAARVIAHGRIGEVDDITAAVPAILSDAFQWATGSVIDLSGGQSI
jgi:NAD(P)-dependent dehydrogenase (short-subunit alcohol dehydrogenase family)